MKYLLKQSRIQHLIQHRNGYLALAGCSLFINILLVFLLFCSIGKERIVLVPPEIEKSFWVSSNKVSPEYLAEMSIFLNNLNFNVTANNAHQQHAILLRYVHPRYYASVKSKLIETEEKLKKQHVTLSFQGTSVKVDASRLVAKIEGDMQYMIGEMALPAKHVTYEWKFQYQDGRLYITSFPEIEKNA